jgi:hypothetical protein
MWSAPAIVSLATPAAAGSSVNPCPNCPSVACYGNTTCSGLATCLCAQTDGGTGPCGCLDGLQGGCQNPACDTDADCPAGSHCYVTCGGCPTPGGGTHFSICIPDCDPAASRAVPRVTTSLPLVRT